MSTRLVALDEGSDIPLDRTMVVVGRHPQCDARLDSLRVSRHHCCMTQDNGDVVVRDLGSTNGIRINGQRVEIGRLRPGDELSIAHIRYRLDGGSPNEMTLADPQSDHNSPPRSIAGDPIIDARGDGPAKNGHDDLTGFHHTAPPPEDDLAAAVRGALPSGLAEKYRIQVIVQPINGDAPTPPEVSEACPPDSSR